MKTTHPLRFIPIAILVWFGATVAACAGEVVLYIATNGADAWSGRLAAPTADHRDGPFASLTRARDEVRKLKATNAVTVCLRGGVYRLQEPFEIGPQDSGTAASPIVYEAIPGERPVLSGGRAITGFLANGPLWETEIPEVKAGRWYFRQLFVNGQRRARARSPNDGYFRTAGFFPGPKIGEGTAYARDRFKFAPGDLRPWDRFADVNLVLMYSWETSIHPLKSVDVASNVVTLAAPMKEWWGLGYWEKKQRYYVENAREFLDQPGEWYLNRETGVLSYWPMPGEKIETAEIVAPQLTELLRIAGDADKGQFVEHVTFRGLAFHHADWILDPKGNSSTQAAVEVPAPVIADGALNCVIEKCEVAHVGTYGVWFRRGCKDCRIQQNRLFDLGAGGIRVGEDRMAQADVAESSRVLVDNNHIFDGGHVYAAGVGIWVAQSSHDTISHNDIHDLLYSGMSIGWNWGLETNRTHHNVIEQNHVHDLVHGVLSDAGLIYCLGVSPGSVIRNNVFHDIWPYDKPEIAWGIYLDAQCGCYLVESNLVFNTRSGGIMFNNGGHEHVIRNNIFALSANEALWPYSEKRPSAFRRNITFLTQGRLFIPWADRSLNERIAAKESPGDWDENIYWHTGGADKLLFYKRTFAQWQSLGLDQHSMIADPQFADVSHNDFRFAVNAPAAKLGIQPIDISHVGLYGESAWAAEARHEKCPARPLPPPPPPPAPIEINDDFETTAIGEPPANAIVSGEESGASIRVSNERAAGGKQSIKITDSKDTKPSWQPHFYYEPNITNGIVRQSFDIWLVPDANVFTEWRDKVDEYPQCNGPSVGFDGKGHVHTAGKFLATMPAGSWFHVEIEAGVGERAARTFKLTLNAPGSAPQIFGDLPISGSAFRELHWLGFSSIAAADTACFLDNLRIVRAP